MPFVTFKVVLRDLAVAKENKIPFSQRRLIVSAVNGVILHALFSSVPSRSERYSVFISHFRSFYLKHYIYMLLQ